MLTEQKVFELLDDLTQKHDAVIDAVINYQKVDSAHEVLTAKILWEHAFVGRDVKTREREAVVVLA